MKYPGAYLFLQVAKKREAFAAAHPDKRIISLGVGDVTLPLAPAVVSAMEAAVREMGRRETFRGYPPTPGYPFLKEKILAGDFAPYGVHLEPEEIFINDGAKGDLGNLGDILSGDDVIAVCDPTYPAYVDSNVVYGRCGEYDAKKGQWSRVIYLPCVKTRDLVCLCRSFPRSGRTSSISAFRTIPRARPSRAPSCSALWTMRSKTAA